MPAARASGGTGKRAYSFVDMRVVAADGSTIETLRVADDRVFVVIDELRAAYSALDPVFVVKFDGGS